MYKNYDFEKFFHDNDIRVHELSEQIPKVNDVTLIVIKGHLVVERCLYSILVANMKNKEYLDKANLSFAQLINLVMAISSFPIHKKTFDIIKKLNSLRNHLAHNLPNHKTDKLVNDFIRSIESNGGAETVQAKIVWDTIYGLLGAVSILISVEELLCSGADRAGIVEMLEKEASKK